MTDSGNAELGGTAPEEPAARGRAPRRQPRPVEEPQQRFWEQVLTQARYAKRRRRLSGHESCDVAALVMESIWKRETYRENFLRDPRSMIGLVPSIASDRAEDLRRRAVALKRPKAEDGRPLEEDVDGDFEACEALEHKNLARAAAVALERLALGEGGAAYFGCRRKRMLAIQAFNMHLEGYSHREIAERLQLPKATVGHRIQALVAYLKTQLG